MTKHSTGETKSTHDDRERRKTPFFIQAAVLERYISSATPENEPGLPAIIKALRKNPSLQRHFFTQRLHPAWGQLLYDQGFFETPPPPTPAGDRFLVTQWFAHNYLCSIAGRVPQVFLRHLKSLEEHPEYLVDAVRALSDLPVDQIEGVLPVLYRQVDKAQPPIGLMEPVYALMIHLAHQERMSALDLMRILAKPHPSPNVKRVNLAPEGKEDNPQYGSMVVNAEAISEFPSIWYDDEQMQIGLNVLLTLDKRQTISVLEEHLHRALEIESEAWGYANYSKDSNWREAIEDTSQDILGDYKTTLLRALRYCLESCVENDPLALEPLLQRYLNEDTNILRRLALHILRRFPASYRTLVKQELLNPTNLTDTKVDHEYFYLMRDAFGMLDADAQNQLLDSILDGPPAAYQEKLRRWIESETTDAEELYTQIQLGIAYWQRDRLQMLEDYFNTTDQLQPRAQERWQELVDTHGRAEHPEFKSYTTGAFRVIQTSPITDVEIARLSSHDLLSYVENWKPSTQHDLGPREISVEGLASAIAKRIALDLPQFRNVLSGIAKTHSHYAQTLLSVALTVTAIDNNEEPAAEPLTSKQEKELWDIRVEFCEALLNDPEIAKNMEGGLTGGWSAVRRSIIELLHTGIKRALYRQIDPLPEKLLPRVKGLLLIGLSDPDPTPEADHPPVGWRSHRDPLHLSINHVRPCALSALVDMAAWKIESSKRSNDVRTTDTVENCESEAALVNHWDSDVEALFTSMLDRTQEPSWGVHAIYGTKLSQLYWIAPNWVTDHIPDIFPNSEEDKAKDYFSAAWEAYVLLNSHLPSQLYQSLKPVYEQAIEFVSMGRLTGTCHQQVDALAAHCILGFFDSDNDFDELKEQNCLLLQFFLRTRPEDRATAARRIIRLVAETEGDRLQAVWEKAMALWFWRIQCADAQGNPQEYDDELSYFAPLLSITQNELKIEELNDELQALLPHLTRHNRGHFFWETLETFVRQQVSRNPVTSMDFYRSMHDTGKRPTWSRGTSEEEIIRAALAVEESKTAAVDLLDSLLKQGISGSNNIYRDILDAHVR